MSSPIRHLEDDDPRFRFPPAWSSDQRLVTETQKRLDIAGQAFIGDRAMLELQRQLALEPNRIPEPSLRPRRGEQNLLLIVARFGFVVGVAAFAAWAVLWLPGFRKAPTGISQIDGPSAPVDVKRVKMVELRPPVDPAPPAEERLAPANQPPPTVVAATPLSGSPTASRAGSPAPASTGSPAPASAGSPAPASAGSPAPAGAGSPAPASDGSPAPASAGSPALASAGSPEPASDGSPAPASAGSPALASTGSPPAPVSAVAQSAAPPKPAVTLAVPVTEAAVPSALPAPTLPARAVASTAASPALMPVAAAAAPVAVPEAVATASPTEAISTPAPASQQPANPSKPISGATSLAPTVDSGEIGMLVARGKDFLASGDLSSAQLLFRRAAEMGSAEAAFALASTYDPRYLAEHKVVGIVGDEAKARVWYQRAMQLGSPEAGRMLAQ
jgi:hypothetical protein